MEINNINVDRYRLHPRILELRVILIFDILERGYDYEKAIEFFKSLCSIMNVNFMNIMTLINKRYDIKRYYKTNRERWYQEVIFAGHIFGESRYFVAKNYLQVTKVTLYRKEYKLKVEDFVSEEWLNALDKSITVCGVPHYKLEAERFTIGIDNFIRTLGHVSQTRTQF